MKNRKHKDFIGEKLNKLKIIDYKFETNKKGYFFCQCDCGNSKWLRSDQVLSEETKSCGCYILESRITHGKSNHRLFTIWRGMRNRCNNANSTDYVRYGGRGITICDEWVSDFQTFYDWAMKNGYRDDLSIDRKNGNGNYEPSNCRWATALEQQNNISTNHNVTINGETKSLSEWSRICGVSRKVILNRVNEGLSDAEILAPVVVQEAEFQSGVRGVKWDRSKQRWKVDKRESGKRIHIGYFKDLEVAVRAKITYEERNHPKQA